MSPTRGVGAMADKTVTDFIQAHRAGVLSLIDGDRPYSIPVEHYFDGKDLYFMVTPRDDARKLKCVRNNARANFVIYDSRRDHREIVKKGIRCGSVLLEGKITLDAIKEINSQRSGKPVQLQRLKLEVESISNWLCPSEKCDYMHPWFERYPEVLRD